MSYKHLWVWDFASFGRQECDKCVWQQSQGVQTVQLNHSSCNENIAAPGKKAGTVLRTLTDPLVKVYCHR
eukprot:3093086-Amphidinium_carterae.1